MTSPIPAAALDSALAIVGTTGAGKTYVAKGAVEQLLWQNRRVCIIDPLDVWYGLKTSADGQQPAYPVVVFGGEHADVPIGVDAGAELGRIIAEGIVHTSIICTAEMTGGEKARFLTPFFEKLYAANKLPLHLVVDEADEVAPQNPMPEVMRLKGAVDKIARRGRVKGFRLLTITQRPAVLDKSVLSQIGTLIAMKLTSPQDRKAIEGWVKGNADEGQAKAVLASLPKLARGEGWIWSPGIGLLERTTFPAISTLDTSRTPEHGEAIVEARAAATVDISAIRAALAPIQGDVSAISIDARREALIGIAETAAGMERMVAEAEERGYQRGLADGETRGFVRGQALQLARMRAALDAMRIDEIPAGSGSQEPAGTPADSPATPIKRSGRSAPKTEASGGNLNGAARKLLAVLDTDPPVRRTWGQVATLAGLKARGGHFNAGRKALIDSGLVREAGGLIEIATPTPGAGPPPADPVAIVERWAGALSGAAPKILRALFAAGGSAERTRLAEQLGMQPRGGHWNAAWKELRDNDIVTVEGDVARLTELFRPDGGANV